MIADNGLETFLGNVLDVSPPKPEQEYWVEVCDRWRPLRPTKVFVTYWYFAAARQRIFFRRLLGQEPPWTLDVVLTGHRFTNAYRASDRVSQYLIGEVIYPGRSVPECDAFTPEDTLFRILLFKVFNKIETWKLLEERFGEIRWSRYDFDQYDALIRGAMERKTAVFSGAYIMPSGSSAFGEAKKHRNYLRLIETMIKDGLATRLGKARRFSDVFDALLSYQLLGKFLAFQYAVDINYSPLIDFSENSFVVAGPGARSGIRKCFADTCGLSEEEIIRLMTERQGEEFERLGIVFPPLWNRAMHLIDCQNLFCEVDKYSRVAHPEIGGIGDRTRIKQKYGIAGAQPITHCWYPPKWGINDDVRETLELAETRGNPGRVPIQERMQFDGLE